mmetsp:Transcript_13979/g.27011  ORF Transcript_13979/g.27011 Transcript_13979/m.27011 type:complete len:110 (-) Transcript_13979:550-879(-)
MVSKSSIDVDTICQPTGTSTMRFLKSSLTIMSPSSLAGGRTAKARWPMCSLMPSEETAEDLDDPGICGCRCTSACEAQVLDLATWGETGDGHVLERLVDGGGVLVRWRD